MLKRNRKNSQSTVGLDLDPSHIAAAEVSVNGSVTLTRGAVVNLRPGILRDGEVTDAPALTEACREGLSPGGAVPIRLVPEPRC